MKNIGHPVKYIFQMLTDFIIKCKKITFVTITLLSSGKFVGTGKLSVSGWQINIFQNLNFYLKAVSCFL